MGLTAKMVDLTSGRLLWGLTIKDSIEGENLTAGELMDSLMRQAHIAGTLPAPAAETKETGKLPAPAK